MDLFEQPAHRQLDDNHAIRRLALCGAAALIAGEMFVMIEESTKSSIGPSRRPGDGRPWGVVALWTSCSIKGGCHPQQKVSADRGPAAMERRHSSYRIRDRWMTAISDGARRRVKLAAIAQDRNGSESTLRERGTMGPRGKPEDDSGGFGARVTRCQLLPHSQRPSHGKTLRVSGRSGRGRFNRAAGRRAERVSAAPSDMLPARCAWVEAKACNTLDWHPRAWRGRGPYPRLKPFFSSSAR